MTWQFDRFMKAPVALLALLTGSTLMAQGLTSALGMSKAPPVASQISIDPLGRNTPRNSMTNFLESCHRNDLIKASRYLDLRKLSAEERQDRGPELARDLAALLDRSTEFDLADLSDRETGASEDAARPGTDELATFQLQGQPVSLQLQRVDRNGTQIWIVSADSVLKISELSTLTKESKLEKLLPAPLVTTKLLGTSAWIWLALILVALIISVVSTLLSRGAIALIRPVAKRYAKDLQAGRLIVIGEPLRLLLSIAVFRACIEAFTPSALLRLYIGYLLTLLFFLGIASLSMRIVDLVSDHIRSRLNTRQQALSFSVIPLGVRIIKVLIFCIAILLTLWQWGYNTNAILAGLGVGGLAVALAAQKTIENLFGSISIISDRPVLVGDFFNWGGNVGTVEDIGLRSTRIRTLDRTVVTIPNSVFSTMSLENYSRRDRMWFHPTLQLQRGTTPEQIHQVMESVTKILKDHPMVDPTDVPLRFSKVNLQSFDLDIFSYVLTDDYNVFLQVQSELLLNILRAVTECGTGFAVPVLESVVSEGNEETAKPFRVLLPTRPTDGHGGTA